MKRLLLLTLAVILTHLTNAQWRQTNGPLGGNMSCFAVDGNKIFAGSYDGGVYLSIDQGIHWNLKNNGLTNLKVQLLVADKNKIFAGTNGGGVFVTNNVGESWNTLNIGLINLKITALAARDSIICAGTTDEFLISKNFGKNWETKNNGLNFNGYYVSAILINGNEIIIAMQQFFMYKSSDYGNTWELIFNEYTSIKKLVKSGDYIYAGTGNGIYVSGDNGQNWVQSNEGLTNHNLSSLISSGNSLYVTCNNSGTSSVGNVFVSSDEANTWHDITTDLTRLFINAIEVIGPNILVGTFAGVYKSSNNGSNWEQSNNGLNIVTTIKTLKSDGTQLFTGTEFGAFKTLDDGQNWIPIGRGMTAPKYKVPRIIRSFAISGSNFFTGTDAGVFLSYNMGDDWIPKTLGLTSFNVYSLAPIGTRLFAATDGTASEGGLLVSTNNGSTWQSKNNGLTEKYSTDVWSVFEIDSNIIIGTRAGNYISSNNGDLWTQEDPGQKYPEGIITSFVKNGSNYFKGTSGAGIFLSTDKGLTWNTANNGLADWNVTNLTRYNNSIFAATKNNGVFLSKDNGTSWTQINQGLTDLTVNSVEIHGNNIFAGTENSGVWIRPLDEIVSTNESKDENLIKIFPNPNQGEFNIEFQETITSENFKLTVLNITGQTILSRQIFHQKEQINLELDPGLYFIKLVSGNNQSVVKKVLLQK